MKRIITFYVIKWIITFYVIKQIITFYVLKQMGYFSKVFSLDGFHLNYMSYLNLVVIRSYFKF